MEPTLLPGDIVIALKKPLKSGDVILARPGDREIIKRLKAIDGNDCYVIGDNTSASTDSRHFGKIKKEAILATSMIVLPRSVPPPKVLHPRAVWFGRVAATVLILMALIHLFRIDTFLPVLDEILPGDRVAANLIGILTILSEVFAIPFVLRMRLSVLAQLMSGALVVIAPLWWVLIDLWTIGLVDKTGQLGAFVTVPSNGWVLGLNLVWLSLSYYILYLLGYNRLTVKNLNR